MLERKFKKIGMVFVTAFILVLPLSSQVEATTKVFNFKNSMFQSQTQVLTVPDLKSITSISVDTGKVVLDRITGDSVRIRLSEGTIKTKVLMTGDATEDSKFVTNQPTPYYNSDGYQGTLSPYVVGTITIPEETTYAYTNRTRQSIFVCDEGGYEVDLGTGLPESIPYDSMGFTGTLYKKGTETWVDEFHECSDEVFHKVSRTYTQEYFGVVTKPAQEMNDYRYQGTVTKEDTRLYSDYYEYNVTVNYETNTPIDLTPPVAETLQLVKAENGTYQVTATISDDLSAIKQVKIANSELSLVLQDGRYVIDGLLTKPSGLILTDEAGNSTDIVPFAKEPAFTFDKPYTLEAKTYASDVKITVWDGTDLSLKAGEKSYDCPNTICRYVLSQNGLVEVINEEGTKKTMVEVRINNIEKTPPKLLLQGQRNPSNPNQLDFNWNSDLENGQLVCQVAGGVETHQVSGTAFPLPAINATYDCVLETTYGEANLTSNRVVIDSDRDLPLGPGTGIEQRELETNIYIEESKIGISYLINAKSNNYKFSEVPLPVNDITNK